MGVKTHSEPKKLITLVPTHLAKQGYDFVFKADAGPECETCRVRTVCLTNLEVGVRYTVKQVKSAEHYCALVDSKAKVVEVEKALFKIRVARDLIKYLDNVETVEFLERFTYKLKEEKKAEAQPSETTPQETPKPPVQAGDEQAEKTTG